MGNQDRIKECLAPLFADYDREMSPANAGALAVFLRRAAEKGVPSKAIDQLAEFYTVTDGVPCLDSFDFHRCDDVTLFEWWDDEELWLAQRDFYTMRWSHGKFCLGDAGTVSFGNEYEFDSLTELLEAAFARW